MGASKEDRGETFSAFTANAVQFPLILWPFSYIVSFCYVLFLVAFPPLFPHFNLLSLMSSLSSTSYLSSSPSQTSRPKKTTNELSGVFSPVTKRDYCAQELVETEKNYVDALNMIHKNFFQPLRGFVPKEDR